MPPAPRNSMPHWRNLPAGWPARCIRSAAGYWTCWPTWRPGSISPTRTCPSSRPRNSGQAGRGRRGRSTASPGKSPRGSEAAELVRAVLAGRPNVGKSSLFNALAGRSRRSSPHQPGTTRDYLTAEVDFGGVRCQLVDTAGWNRSSRVPAAEVRPLGPGRRGQTANGSPTSGSLPRFDTAAERLGSGRAGPPDPSRLVVLTKADAPPATDCPGPAHGHQRTVGRGLAALRGQLRRQVLAAGAPAAKSSPARPPDAASRCAWPSSAWPGPASSSPKARSWWPPSCGWRWTSWAASRGPSTPTTCWTASSAGSASGSKAPPGGRGDLPVHARPRYFR